MYLGSEEIKKLVYEQNLISNYVRISDQLQPNGFDLTIWKIEKFKSAGRVEFSEKELPEMEEVKKGEDNKWHLPKGAYLVTFNEVVKLPKGIAGLSIQRSTIMRCGITVIVGSWDSGYEGRGQNLIVVNNPHGVTLAVNAKLVQMHFVRIMGENFLYEGHYQKEHMKE